MLSLKKISMLALFLFSFILFVSDSNAQTQDPKSIKHGPGFIDANGDGYNDNAPDADGDGIPNGQDADYTGPKSKNGRGFVDANGDGINDRMKDADGDGIPNGKDADYVRPQNGSGKKYGNGKGNGSGMGSGTGTGVCDGTGPKGKGGRK